MAARMGWPLRMRSKVWRLKDEKVMNPPQMPTMIKRRMFSETGNLPLARVRVPKKPMMKEPQILMMIVPQGSPWGVVVMNTEMR